MCTDGIIEARNAAGKVFGFERVLSHGGRNGSAFQALKHEVYAHIDGSGRDDITLVEVTVVAPNELPQRPARPPEELPDVSEKWHFCYELGPRSLRASNPLPLLQHIVVEFPRLRRHAGAIQSVFSELYSNALEHGLLGLDSGMKFTPSGFADYYLARQRALATLVGFVRFEFRCHMDGGSGRLQVTVTDSGPGFDYGSLLNEREHADAAATATTAGGFGC